MRVWIWGIVALVLTLGMSLLSYHLSGRWAFNHWKAERVAEGDRFEWKNLAPSKVEPDQNFAEAPLIRGAIVDKQQVDPRFKALAIPESVESKLGNWMEGRRDDFITLNLAYGTSDLSTVFKPLEARLKELEQAARRPSNRFPISYEQGQIPALLGFRGVVRTLRVRALWNLRSGHSDLALEDFRTCLRMANHLKAEPHLISALLRAAIIGISMQVIWEGIEDRHWSADQLEVIQSELSTVDLLATLKLAWQGERQGFIDVMTATAENQPLPKYWASPTDRSVTLGVLGRGWFYRNLLAYCRFISSMVDAQDPSSHRVFPNRLIDPTLWLKKMRFRKDLIMAQIAIPALTDQVTNFARRQALIDECILCCALERYRLEKGVYPDCLGDLSPAFISNLPHDLVTGGPMKYFRERGTFTLYQVGWDGKDDGGKPGWVGDGAKRKIDPAMGDWVWLHATR